MSATSLSPAAERSPDALYTAIRELFGPHRGAIADAARDFAMNYDNLRQMLSSRRPVPERVWARIDELRSLRAVTPPTGRPPGSERDAECLAAVTPTLTTLVRRATSAGWRETEVGRAMKQFATLRKD